MLSEGSVQRVAAGTGIGDAIARFDGEWLARHRLLVVRIPGLRQVLWISFGVRRRRFGAGTRRLRRFAKPSKPPKPAPGRKPAT